MSNPVNGANQYLNTLISNFGSQYGTDSIPYKDLIIALNLSSDAVTELNAAASAASPTVLNSITVSATPNSDVLGAYTPTVFNNNVVGGTLSLSTAVLGFSPTAPTVADLGQAIWTIAHEGYHADNATLWQANENTFANAVASSTAGDASPDLTNSMSAYQNYIVDNEATAELTGWNAYVAFATNQYNSIYAHTTPPMSLAAFIAGNSSTSNEVIQVVNGNGQSLSQGPSINNNYTVTINPSNIQGIVNTWESLPLNQNFYNQSYLQTEANPVGPAIVAGHTDNYVFNISALHLTPQTLAEGLGTYTGNDNFTITDVSNPSSPVVYSFHTYADGAISSYTSSAAPGSTMVFVGEYYGADATGSIVTDSNANVIVAGGYSTTVNATGDNVQLFNGASATNVAGNSNTFVASPNSVGLDNNSTSAATVTGSGTMSEGISSPSGQSPGGDAQLIWNGADASLNLTADSSLLVTQSGNAVEMEAGSNVDTSNGQTVTLTCGKATDGTNNTWTISGAGSNSTTCAVDSNGVGALTVDSGGSSVTATGHGSMDAGPNGVKTDMDPDSSVTVQPASAGDVQRVSVNEDGTIADDDGDGPTTVSQGSAPIQSLYITGPDTGQSYDAASLGVNAIVDVAGSDALSTGGLSNVTLVGVSNDTLTGNDDGGAFVVFGNGVQVNATGETIYDTADSSSVLSGAGNVDNVGAGAALDVSGAGGNTIDGSTGASVTDASTGDTFTGGNYAAVLGANDLNFTDEADNLTFSDAAGVSGGNVFLDANYVTFNDDAYYLTVLAASGAVGGVVTLGNNNTSLTDSANGLTIGDAVGVSGGDVTLGANALNTTDDAANLTITDASGVTGGNVTFGVGGLNLDDDATGGLGVGSASGVTNGSVTLEANNLGLWVGASGLAIGDASGVTGGTLTLAVSNLSTTDDASNLTVNAASGVTGGTVTLGDSNSSVTDDASGTTIDTAAGVTGNTVSLGGSGDVVDLTGGTVSLDAADLVENIHGASDTINGNGYSGEEVGLYNNGDVVNVSNGAVWFNSANESDVVDGASNTVFTDGNAGDNIGVNGSGDVLNVANGTVSLNAADLTVNVDGASNTLNTEGYAGDTVGMNGTDDVLYMSNGSAWLNSAGQTVNINGSSNSINANGNTGDVVGMSGTGDVLYMNSGTAWLNSADQTTNIDGSYNTITANGNSGDNVGMSGTGDVLYMANGTAWINNADQSVNVDGASDTINTQGYAGDNVGLNSSGDWVNITNGTVWYNNANESDNVDGASDTINTQGYAGDSVGLYSNGDWVNIASGTVWYNEANQSADINGASNTINTQGYGGDSVTLTSGSAGDWVNIVGGTVYTDDDVTGLTVYGNSNTVDDGADGFLTLSGSGDTLYMNTGDSAYAYGGGNYITLGAYQHLFVSGTGGAFDTISASGDNGGTANDGEGAGIDVDANAQASIYGSNDNVYMNTGDSVYAYGGNNDITLGGNQFLFVSGTNYAFDTINVTGDTGGTAINGQGSGIDIDFDAQANINGSGDAIFLNTGDSAGVYGGGNTITLGADQLLEVGQTNGWFDTINASGDVTGGTTANGQGTGIIFGSDDQGSVTGNDDFISSGDSSTIYVTGDDEDVSVDSGDIVYVSGSDDTIDGDTSDQFYVTGEDDPIDASDSTIDYSGSNSGDVVTGSGDTGSDWDGDDPGGGGGGYGYYGYAFAGGKQPRGANIGAIAAYYAGQGDSTAANAAEAARLQAASAAAEISPAGLAAAAFEGPKWAGKTISWTLDVPTGPNSPFTGALASEYENAVQQAFQTWAQASGLNIFEVTGSSNADIKIGLGGFDSVDTGILGLTKVKNSGQNTTGALITLEDPADDPITADAVGQAAYGGTSVEFEQLILHEIGHVLGLADSSDPNSIMAPTLSSANRTLDDTDMEAIQALYGSGTASIPSAAASSAYWSNLQSESSQLIDSIAGFTSATSPALTSLLPAGASGQIPIQLAAAH